MPWPGMTRKARRQGVSCSDRFRAWRCTVALRAMTALALPLPMSLSMAWPTDTVDPSARVPHPPSDAERARRRPTPMWQAVLLAALLHLWLAVLLGSVPPGSALPGQGVWGAINLRLQAPGDGPAVRDAAPQPPLPAAGPPGDAPATRWGGAVRAQAPAPAAEPGAAQLGDWAPVPAWSARSAELPATAQVADPGSTLNDLPGLPALGDRPEPPRLQAPPAVPSISAPALASMPAAPAARLAELQSLPAPALLEAPLVRLAGQPVALPAPGLAPLARTAPASLADVPLAVPALPALQPVAPAESSAPDVGSTPAPAPASAPEPTPAAAAASPASPPAPANASAPAFPSPAPSPASRPLHTAAPGLPDAGTRTGADIATAPSAPASAPRLNLQLPRSRGGELSRLGSAGVLALMPRPPELKSRLEREVEKSGQADCRTAHARMGLLAVVPLVADALKDEGGCRW